MIEFRCQKCQKLLLKYDRCQKLEVKCPRCGEINSLHKLAGLPRIDINNPAAAAVNS